MSRGRVCHDAVHSVCDIFTIVTLSICVMSTPTSGRAPSVPRTPSQRVAETGAAPPPPPPHVPIDFVPEFTFSARVAGLHPSPQDPKDVRTEFEWGECSPPVCTLHAVSPWPSQNRVQDCRSPRSRNASKHTDDMKDIE